MTDVKHFTILREKLFHGLIAASPPRSAGPPPQRVAASGWPLNANLNPAVGSSGKLGWFDR